MPERYNPIPISREKATKEAKESQQWVNYIISGIEHELTSIRDFHLLNQFYIILNGFKKNNTSPNFDQLKMWAGNQEPPIDAERAGVESYCRQSNFIIEE